MLAAHLLVADSASFAKGPLRLTSTLQIPRGTTTMITFIFVVAVAAFIPYVAAPGIVNGVKAINAQPAAMRFETSPAASDGASDAANRIGSERREGGASV
ncbi:hypothetical protein [Paraburkholderia sp.]|uniref:hypothetical protein n=1 Tax=Paraburkholderia sp. TaxID=1926495 RepID=UPI002AFF105C|nr:hypothetical protein [Paraburkholderia sp.]